MDCRDVIFHLGGHKYAIQSLEAVNDDSLFECLLESVCPTWRGHVAREKVTFVDEAQGGVGGGGSDGHSTRLVHVCVHGLDKQTSLDTSDEFIRNAVAGFMCCCHLASPGPGVPLSRPLAEVATLDWEDLERFGIGGDGKTADDLDELSRETDVAAKFVESLKRRAFAKARLPQEMYERIRMCQWRSHDFFDMCESVKMQYHVDTYDGKRMGYFSREDLGKELWQVRLCPSSMRFPTDVPSRRSDEPDPVAFRARMEEFYAILDDLGQRLMRVIASATCKNPLAWDGLCSGCSSEDPPLESSQLGVFRYNNAPTTDVMEACDMHCDYSLLTIIPKAMGGEALEILDWSEGWTNVEKGMQPNEVTIMVGDSMERLTGGYLLPTIHRVIMKDDTTARLSAPFLMHARHSALLDPSAIDESLFPDKSERDAFQEACREPVQTSYEFCKFKISTTPSVTFGAKYNVMQ